MNVLFVVGKASDWPLTIAGVEVVSAGAYLTDPAYLDGCALKVFNLSRSYRYQTAGYYVSLLAEARGHRPLPSVATLQDLRSRSILRLVSDDLDRSVQRSLARIKGDEFVLSIYFGRNMARRHQPLARQLFNLFPSPLLRARFVRGGDRWRLTELQPISGDAIPESHRPFALEAAKTFFAGRGAPRRRTPARYDLAILLDPDESSPPSGEAAIARFERVAGRLGFRTERIGRDDIGRLSGFDALWIRATTAVDHYTFRFAQRAATLGLVVIDDPVSIIRCTNKVYLAEVLVRHRIPAPATLVVHRGNVSTIVPTLGLPCILKAPDSSFSLGVVKVDDEDALERELARLFRTSDLVVAQRFTPTDFDWRVGVLDGKALYACKYHMAPDHWQIYGPDTGGGERSFGQVTTLPVEEAPPRVLRVALQAARWMGDGLYGVDLKQFGKKVHLIEVNDNPSLDVGDEDRVLGDELYQRLAASFAARIEKRRAGR